MFLRMDRFFFTHFLSPLHLQFIFLHTGRQFSEASMFSCRWAGHCRVCTLVFLHVFTRFIGKFPRIPGLRTLRFQMVTNRGGVRSPACRSISFLIAPATRNAWYYLVPVFRPPLFFYHGKTVYESTAHPLKDLRKRLYTFRPALWEKIP